MKARLKITAHQDKLTIDLPAAMAAALGDEVEVEIVRPAPEPTVSRQALMPLRKYRGRMPPNFKFDRHDANSR